jgi:tape measure domain-containing protein
LNTATTPAVHRFGRDGKAAGMSVAAGMSRARAGVQSISTQLADTRRELLAFFSVTQGAQLLGGQVALVDQVTLLDARLRLATDSAREFATADAEIFRIANELRAPLAEMTDLYAKLSPSMREANRTQVETLGITQAVAQSIKLSGASAESSAAAILQFGQAMASGVLQGDEFKSLMENAPRLAQALADGMGVARGELKQMSAEGRLTTKAVVDALLTQRDALSAEFEQLPMTVGDAMTKVRNEWQKTLGDMDADSGATRTLAEGLSSIADNMRSIVSAGETLLPLLAGVAAAKLLASTRTSGLALAMRENYQAHLAYMSPHRAVTDGLRTQYVPAVDRATAGTRAWAAATSSMATAGNVLRGAVGFLGGPVGIITLAATAAMMFSSSSSRAAINADEWRAKVDGLNSSLKTMSLQQLDSEKFSLEKQIRAAEKVIADGPGLFNRDQYNEATDAVFFMRGQLTQLNNQIKAVSGAAKKSGDDIGVPSDGLIAMAQDSAQALAKAFEQAYVATRTPLEQFEDTVATAKAVFEQFGEANGGLELYNRTLQLAQDKFNAASDKDKTPQLSAHDQWQVEQDQAHAQAFFSLQESLKSQSQLIEESYAERAGIIQNALALNITDQESAQQMMLTLTESYNQQIIASQRQVRDANLSVTADLFGSMAQLAQQGGGKTFKWWKMLSRAQTILSTYSGAQKAFESQLIPGDPTSLPRAWAAGTAATLAGLARLASINMTSMSSTSAGGAPVGGAPIGSGQVAPVVPTAPRTTPQNFVIYINGKLWDAVVDKTEAARELRPYMQELERDTI